MNIIGIGDNVVDDYVDIRTMFPGGNALNVAVYASMLGCDAAYLGVFGNDAAADHVQQTLTTLGIDISRCRTADGPNGRAVLTIDEGERIFLESNAGGIRKSVSMDFIFDDIDYLRGFRVAHTSAYSYIDKQLARLQTLAPIISYDFSDDFDTDHALGLCRHLDIAFFSCGLRSEEETRELLKNAVHEGCSIAVATRGPEGAVLFDGETWFRQAPEAITPIDTLGAGDAFISAFLVACAGALDREGSLPAGLIEDSLVRGASFAAEICALQGAFGHGLRY